MDRTPPDRPRLRIRASHPPPPSPRPSRHPPRAPALTPPPRRSRSRAAPPVTGRVRAGFGGRGGRGGAGRGSWRPKLHRGGLGGHAPPLRGWRRWGWAAPMSWFGREGNLTSVETWGRAEVPELPGDGPVPLLRDTASGELLPAVTGPVATMYACGITPYDATHIGHAATYTAWDLLVRAMLDSAPRPEVVYAQNVTDVDEPLLERAERDHEDWRELALRETDRYRRDMEALRVLPPTYLVG